MKRLRFSEKQFWIYMRNFSASGAITMLTLAFVFAQTDLTMLPIGGAMSDAPEVGAVWSCRMPNGRGAQVEGPWLDTINGIFDLTAKAIVDGDNNWDGEYQMVIMDDTRLIVSNALPIDHNTGTYPVQSSDDAYQYDRNPHTITAQEIMLELPANPLIADEPSCLDMGAIGIMKSGVVFFNALDAEARDAAAYETQDECEGHPESSGEYHYHTLSPCVAATDTEEGHSILMGYAHDGFGIYGYRGEDGEVLTNAELDECHGHTHMIEWDGVEVEIYHYHATYEYPYTLGCYRGTPIVTQQGDMQGQGQGGNGQQQPPQGNNNNENRPPRDNGNPPPRPGGGG